MTTAKQWKDVKIEFIAEFARCKKLVDFIAADIKNECGQNVNNIYIYINVYTLALNEEPEDINNHWKYDISCYEKAIKAMKELNQENIRQRLESSI